MELVIILPQFELNGMFYHSGPDTERKYEEKIEI